MDKENAIEVRNVTKKFKIYAVAISMITSVLTNVIINSIFILREFSRNNIKARSRL